MTRQLFLLILIFANSQISGQDTIFFDQNRNEVNSFFAARRYTVLEKCEVDNERTIEKTFFKSGQLISEKHYKPYDERVLDGKRIEWHENGQLHMDIEYKEGELHGYLLTFWGI